MPRRVRLCVLTTHPIQYIAPWYRQLATQDWLDLHVVFARIPSPAEQGRGFDRAFTWDTPLLEGYAHSVLNAGQGLQQAARGAWRFRALLAKQQPDALLVTGWNEPLLVLGALASRSLQVPVLMRGESNDLKPRPTCVRVAQRVLMQLPSAFVQIGRANRRFYRDCRVPSERIFDGVYFVDNVRMLQMAQRHAADKASLRQSMGFAEGDMVFAFCGKHVPFKQPQLLIEAAALARQQGLPVALLFAGSGPLTEALKARAQDLAVPCHFSGFLNQTELWKAYVPADAFVLPSTVAETWGLVTNEAMLFGLPVLVSTQVGCGEDLVLEGATGLRFDPQPAALAQAMATLCRDPALAARMGAAGRAHVQARYSMDVATAGLRAALLHLVPGAAPPAGTEPVHAAR